MKMRSVVREAAIVPIAAIALLPLSTGLTTAATLAAAEALAAAAEALAAAAEATPTVSATATTSEAASEAVTAVTTVVGKSAIVSIAAISLFELAARAFTATALTEATSLTAHWSSASRDIHRLRFPSPVIRLKVETHLITFLRLTSLALVPMDKYVAFVCRDETEALSVVEELHCP